MSRATVSYALRGHAKIPSSTRELVVKTAEGMGYRANRHMSRVMSDIRGRTGNYYKENLGYLVHYKSSDQYYAWPTTIWKSVQKRAAEIGYGVDRLELDDTKSSLQTCERIIRSRGIRGIIIAPFTEAHIRLQIRVENLAMVAIGHTLEYPDVHRIGRDIVHSFEKIADHIQLEGYQRVAYASELSHEDRMDKLPLSRYLMKQWDTGLFSVEPFVRDLSEFGPSQFLEWFEAKRPDMIITFQGNLIKWLELGGYHVPADVSVIRLNSDGVDTPDSGVYANYESLGETAVEQLSGLVERGEFGIPTAPKTVLVKGLYNEGRTLRKPLSKLAHAVC